MRIVNFVMSIKEKEKKGKSNIYYILELHIK